MGRSPPQKKKSKEQVAPRIGGFPFGVDTASLLVSGIIKSSTIRFLRPQGYTGPPGPPGRSEVRSLSLESARRNLKRWKRFYQHRNSRLVALMFFLPCCTFPETKVVELGHVSRKTTDGGYDFGVPAHQLGPPVVPFSPFWGEGSPTKIDYRKS